jgi:paraquat-inducible protein A
MAAESMGCCDTCGLVQAVEPLAPGMVAECTRCGSFLTARRSTGSLHVTAALSLAALVLYVPANVYPIMKMYLHGAYSESTVWDGIKLLMDHHEWAVAIIVFMASMVIPLVKLAGLFSLVVTSGMGWGRRLRGRTHLYKFIDAIGPWAMLDVFLLALAFTAMVVLTMLASAAFDPKLIWQRP